MSKNSIAAPDITFEGVDAATIAAVEELARQEWQLAALQAQIEQEEFARHCKLVNGVEGVGEVTRMVHAFAYHDWAHKLGSYECWQDKGFQKYFDRIAPETKVKCVAPKSGNGLALQVGWTPPEGKRRFTKKYDAEKERRGDAERKVGV